MQFIYIGGAFMKKVKKEQVWMDWKGFEHKLECVEESYVMDMEMELKMLGRDVGKGLDAVVTVGNATLHMTDEAWISNKGTHSLTDHIHMDFNEDVNWNEPTNFEILEDALLCTKYGQKTGISGTVAVLHKISIPPFYQGKGLFPIFLQSLLNVCVKLKADYVVLQPHPFGDEKMEKEDVQAGIARLRTFYRRFGFVDFPLEKGVAYMVLPVERYKATKSLKAVEMEA